MSTKVFVSGATGFIARQTIKLLLSRGYKVVGSVRSSEKGEILKKSYGASFSYEIVEVLERDGAFDEALKKHPDVTIFLHTASPVTPFSTELEKNVLIPAISGTKYVLKSIYEYAPQITRVVVTSSWAAIIPVPDRFNPKFVGSEDIWNPITYEEAKQDSIHAYFGSKTFAEKAAWEFVEKNKPNFDLSTVNPVFVLGPQSKDEEVKDTLNVTAELVNSILKLNPKDEVPTLEGNFVDVRDVALAHVLAFEKEEAKGQRLVLVTERYSGQLVLDIIRKNFPELGDKLPVGVPGSKDGSNFAAPNDKKTRSILGFDRINLEKSVVDAVEQIQRVKA